MRNSVPDKKFEEMWDYTLRFLGSSEELEENTSYTDAYGTDQILPAKVSHVYKAPRGGDRRGSGGGANGGGASGVAYTEENVAEEGNKFFER